MDREFLPRYSKSKNLNSFAAINRCDLERVSDHIRSVVTSSTIGRITDSG